MGLDFAVVRIGLIAFCRRRSISAISPHSHKLRLEPHKTAAKWPVQHRTSQQTEGATAVIFATASSRESIIPRLTTIGWAALSLVLVCLTQAPSVPACTLDAAAFSYHLLLFSYALLPCCALLLSGAGIARGGCPASHLGSSPFLPTNTHTRQHDTFGTHQTRLTIPPRRSLTGLLATTYHRHQFAEDDELTRKPELEGLSVARFDYTPSHTWRQTLRRGVVDFDLPLISIPTRSIVLCLLDALSPGHAATPIIVFAQLLACPRTPRCTSSERATTNPSTPFAPS